MLILNLAPEERCGVVVLCATTFANGEEENLQVDKWDTEKDGIFSEAALRRKLEKKGYHVTRYIYPPGTFFPSHQHSVDKIDAVVSGRFKMTTSEGSVILEAGDCLAIPRGTVPTAEVVGREPVVSLDATKG